MPRRTLLLFTLWLFGVAALVHAHPMNVSFAEISITSREVRWRLHIPTADIETFDTRVTQYLATRVKVEQDGRALPAEFSAPRIWNDPDGNPYVETIAVFTLPDRGVQSLTLSCDLLREVTPGYKTIAFISFADRTEQWIFENGGVYEMSFAAPGHQFAAFALFVRMGVLHIFTGYDHLAFLLGVVLMGGTMRAIVKIVTSFTIAHSITLALAALNIVNVPSRIVESGIALSIMYIACENLFFSNFDRRWIVTFFFGLVHGFGFASALREVHLSRGLLGTALFSFNVGVECGQLAIVALLLPALLYLRKQTYSATVIRACSMAIFLLGSFWLWQRLSIG